MRFKIVFMFTYKEESYFTLKCVTSLFDFLYRPNFNCKNRTRNRNL